VSPEVAARDANESGTLPTNANAGASWRVVRGMFIQKTRRGESGELEMGCFAKKMYTWRSLHACDFPSALGSDEVTGAGLETVGV
jgi:hypothetical protein